MKLKRTITLMILAGVLTAGLASCVVKPNGNEDPSGTEGPLPPVADTTLPSNDPTIPNQPTDPSQVQYTPVNETVYTIANVSMKPVSDPNNPSAVIPIGAVTEMTRVGVSAVWSKVNYAGAEYYVLTASLTTDDIGEKTFTAVNKTMYAAASLNIREKPSAEDSFSKIIGGYAIDDAVTVIAENGTWSKVKFEGNKVGFVRSKYLATQKSQVSVNDYIGNFTKITPAKTMYVDTDTANLRWHPYVGDKGTLVVGGGLTKGTPVIVVAEGTVEGRKWYAVEWEIDSIKQTCYMSQDVLTGVSSSTATLEQMLATYPTLKKFDASKIMYVYVNNANGRSAPTRYAAAGQSNVVKSLVKGDTVTAVAAGKIAGQDDKGGAEEISWYLIQDAQLGYYFVSMSVLTSDSNLKPSVPALSLDELVSAYDFTKLSTVGTMVTKDEVKPCSAPSADAKMDVTIAKGTTVKVLAKGSVASGFVENDWYLIEHNNTHYFVVSTLLELA